MKGPNERHLPYFKLIEALESPGCPICRQAEEAVESSINALLTELVTDAHTRTRIAESFGFCREHAWRLVAHADVLGTAMIHRELVRRFRGLVRSGRGALTAPDRARRPSCPLCATRAETADRALAILIEHLNDDKVAAALAGSDGLCRSDFAAAAAALHNRREQAERLASIQEGCLDRLLGDLDELIRKNDYRFRDEGLEPSERDAWTRGVAAVSGLDVARLPRRRPASFPPPRRPPP
ncbi:MAG TPA: DUF6062 family protein [Candidatus Dormibacteraeota bacterium]|nr:DUF6062 family protein [Candidatus Dormibacteraeota bacterium]